MFRSICQGCQATRSNSSPRPSSSTSILFRSLDSSPIIPSSYKGKGRALENSRSISTPRKGKEIEESGIRKVSGLSASSNTILESPAVHEDLLSTSASSSSKKSGLPYFSQSFLGTGPIALPSTSPLLPYSTPIPSPLPNSVLSNGLPNPLIKWREKPNTSIKDDLSIYKTLAKARLSALVVLTAMAGYVMCPIDPSTTSTAMELFAQSLSGTTTLETLTALPSTSSTILNSKTLSILLPTTVGTTLCAASAASFNQLIEAPYDSQMTRTRSRPMPRRFISPLHATTFGVLSGGIGLSTLYFINPLCAGIGLATIVLYFPLYTIAKRHTIYNTWLGAVVGALPPLIGWSACSGSLDPFTQPGAYAMFSLLFFWQFPHFLSLAHTLRSSYAASGYRMLSVLNPSHNALVCLRYSAAMIPLSISFPLLGLTTSLFPILAAVPNGIMLYTAWRFYRKREERRAKELFWASLGHLPVVLGLAMVCKKDLWQDTKIEVEEENEALIEA